MISLRDLYRAASILVLAFGVMFMPGCYTRVTKAKGIGADAKYPNRYESSEPVIDQWIDDATGQDN